jgi:hypothetical protein
MEFYASTTGIPGDQQLQKESASESSGLSRSYTREKRCRELRGSMLSESILGILRQRNVGVFPKASKMKMRLFTLIHNLS